MFVCLCFDKFEQPISGDFGGELSSVAGPFSHKRDADNFVREQEEDHYACGRWYVEEVRPPGYFLPTCATIGHWVGQYCPTLASVLAQQVWQPKFMGLPLKGRGLAVAKLLNSADNTAKQLQSPSDYTFWRRVIEQAETVVVD